ncbi:MAG TPA: hypothetical protein VNA65_01540 [Candidatus Dormibacteraeota bacterium]|nr:hypothetical protein [Candidatus Dormibacteraeota bacterium]
MRTALVMVVVALAACTGGSGAPAALVSPTATASSSPSPVVTGGTGGWSINCRLPVTWSVQDGQTITSKAGFLSFPDRSLAEDPTAPAHSSFYDRAFSKWLPTWRVAVSPDGKRYAYTEGNAYQGTNGKVHVVDVATGADRVIYSGNAVYSVVDFNADGIYLTFAAPEGAPRGLFLESPSGGTPRTIVDTTMVAPAVGGGAAWGLDFNAADPSPAPGGLEGPRNEVLRYDLRNGAATSWFYRPGADVGVIGFDSAGDPFVSAAITDPNGQSTFELWLVKSPTSAMKLPADPAAWLRLAAVDGYGVWFDGGSYGPLGQVWLYQQGQLAMVAHLPLNSLAVAGGCIPY